MTITLREGADGVDNVTSGFDDGDGVLCDSHGVGSGGRVCCC